MKNFIFLCCALFAVPALAQEDSEEKITRVEITIEEDGETRTIIRELKDEDFDGDVRVYRFKSDENGLMRDFPQHQFQIQRKLEHHFKEAEGEKEEVAFMGVTGHTQQMGEARVVMLDKIIEDEPAAKAGLQPGDIIISVDDQELETYEELVKLIRSKEPGESVKLEIRRDGKKQKVDLVLGKRVVSKGLRFNWEMDENFPGEHMKFFYVEELSDEEKSIIRKNTGIDVDGDNSFQDVDIELYPNPTPGKIEFQMNLSKGGKLMVEVFNDAGKSVTEIDLEDTDGNFEGSLDLSDQPAGNYLVMFRMGDKILVEKILKI